MTEQAWKDAASSALTAAKDCLARSEAQTASWRGREPKIGVDSELDALIRQSLAGTGLPVLSEECEAQPAWHRAGPLWIVDPLDGSLNFARGTGPYAVSIALWEGERPLFGAILHGPTGRIAFGAPPGPATMGARRLACSAVSKTSHAILCTGIPSGFDIQSGAADWTEMLARYGKVRMIGSATCSLLHVASGEADAYFEDGIRIWDVAAGIALVEAAGGTVQMTASPEYPTKVRLYATNGRIG